MDRERATMNADTKWTMTTLREHAGEALLLGNGAVAVVYEMCQTNQARVAWFLFTDGRFAPCVVETRRSEMLLSVLRRWENTHEVFRRCVANAAANNEPMPSEDTDTANVKTSAGGTCRAAERCGGVCPNSGRLLSHPPSLRAPRASIMGARRCLSGTPAAATENETREVGQVDDLPLPSHWRECHRRVKGDGEGR